MRRFAGLCVVALVAGCATDGEPVETSSPIGVSARALAANVDVDDLVAPHEVAGEAPVVSAEETERAVREVNEQAARHSRAHNEFPGKADPQGKAIGLERLRARAVQNPNSLVASVVAEPAGAKRIQQVRSLVFTITLDEVAAPMRVGLELRKPDGVPFSWQAQEIPAGRRVPVQFRVPVAGTTIQHRHLAGRWKGQFLVEGMALTSAETELLP